MIAHKKFTNNVYITKKFKEIGHKVKILVKKKFYHKTSDMAFLYIYIYASSIKYKTLINYINHKLVNS